MLLTTMLNMYNIKQITNYNEWNEFNKKLGYSLFVQSSKYIDFYRSTNEQGWIFGIYDDNNVLIGGSVCVSVRARRGSFLYLPYGPVLINNMQIQKDRKVIFAKLFITLKELSHNENLSFIRVSPFIKNSKEVMDDFRSLGFRRAPLHVLAEHTWLLDVTPDQEELLASMKKNHRNLIRRCEREGVIIKKTRENSGLKHLDTLLDITAKRHNFTRFSSDYIKKEFDAFASSKEALIYEAYLPGGELDAVAIIMRHGSMFAYRHSASLNLNKKLPTSYLLQWEVIKDAKKQGAKLYNFWGIAPKNASKKHPFYGITHFKKGFGGFGLDLIPCIDLPVNSKYWFNWLIETIRRVKRGF